MKNGFTKSISMFLSICIISLLLVGCSSEKTSTNLNADGQNSDESYNDSRQALSNNETPFEKVDITLNNYENYFEFKDRFYANQDEFGDYTGTIFYGTYFCLKDQYEAETGYRKSNVKIKYKHSIWTYGFDFNQETGEWKLLDVVDKYDDVYETSDYLDQQLEDWPYSACINGREFLKATIPGLYGDYKYLVSRAENIEITGIMGTLYVRKKAQ